MVYFRCLLVNPHVQAVQKKERICGVQKNRYGHNFQNIASKMNQRWAINYDKPLIHFGSDILKIVAESVFLTPHFFANRPHFVALTQLRATKTVGIAVEQRSSSSDKKITCTLFITEYFCVKVRLLTSLQRSCGHW